MMITKQYHIPRDEAIEKFIDNSESFDSNRLTDAKETEFVTELLELGAEGWDIWQVVYYSYALDTIKYIKKQGYKVKVINKDTKVIILYKIVRRGIK